MSEGLVLPESVEISSTQIPQYQVFPGLKNIACRLAIINEKPTNVYHIKPIKPIGLAILVGIMHGIVDDAEIDVVDPDNTLRLEWPIVMKINSIFGNELIEGTLKEIDNYLEAK